MSEIHKNNGSTVFQHFVSEQGKQTLQDRAIELQTEVTRLQMELNQISNQLDNQNRKYLNLKLQTKEKMENARYLKLILCLCH